MPLIGNKVTERDIRDFLTEKGFLGQSARFYELELVAIERPGWVQIFQFQVSVKRKEGPWQEVYGVVRDDERNKTDIAIFETAEEQQKKIELWSTGFIRRGKSSPSPLEKRLLLIFVGFLFALFAIAMFRSL